MGACAGATGAQGAGQMERAPETGKHADGLRTDIRGAGGGRRPACCCSPPPPRGVAVWGDTSWERRTEALLGLTRGLGRRCGPREPVSGLSAHRGCRLLMQPPRDKAHPDKAHQDTAGDAQWSRWGGGAWAGIRGGAAHPVGRVSCGRRPAAGPPLRLMGGRHHPGEEGVECTSNSNQRDPPPFHPPPGCWGPGGHAGRGACLG